MADTAFREELTALVEEIKDVAYERHLAQAEDTANEPFVDRDALRNYLDMRLTEHGLGRFQYFTQGDLDAFQTMIQRLNDPQVGARKELTDGLLEDIDLTLQHIAGWGGRAANAFRNGYVTQLGSAINNQLVYIEELSRILACYHRILSSARQDIKTIANNTIEALQGLDTGRSSSAAGFFTVVAVVASVVGTGAFGIPPAVAAAAAVTEAGAEIFSGMAQAAPEPIGDGERPEFSVSGSTIFEVLDSMDGRIDELYAHMLDEERYISEGLDSDIGYFDSVSDVDRILPDRPNTADVPDLPGADEFGNPDRVREILRDRPEIADFPQSWRPGDDPNDFEPPGGVVTLDNLAKLYAAGDVMSSLAYRYHSALGDVYAASGREGSAFEYGVTFGYTYGKWTTARDLLRYLLLQTKDNLVDASDALHRIAYAYADAEGINRDQLDAAIDVELEGFDRTTMEDWEQRVSAPSGGTRPM